MPQLTRDIQSQQFVHVLVRKIWDFTSGNDTRVQDFLTHNRCFRCKLQKALKRAYRKGQRLMLPFGTFSRYPEVVLALERETPDFADSAIPFLIQCEIAVDQQSQQLRKLPEVKQPRKV